MNSFLNFTCGNYELLLSASYILEVGLISGFTQDEYSESSEEEILNKKTKELHRIWRDRNLPVVNLGGYLKLIAPAPHFQLVTYDSLSEGESELTILDVENISGLLEINEEEFVDIATPSQNLEQFIDKSYIHPVSKKCLLRMSYPFNWLSTS